MQRSEKGPRTKVQFFATASRHSLASSRRPLSSGFSQAALVSPVRGGLSTGPNSKSYYMNTTATRASLYDMDKAPEKDPINALTAEIMEAVHTKLASLEDKQRGLQEKGRMLSAEQVKAREELKQTREAEESARKALLRLRYANKRLEEDCAQIQQELDICQSNTGNTEKEFDETAGVLRGRITALAEQNEIENRAAKQERDQQVAAEKALTEERQEKQRRIDEVAKEAVELREQVDSMLEKESEQIERFMDRRRTLDVSVGVMKTLSATSSRPLFFTPNK